jgi:hypothetical protein
MSRWKIVAVFAAVTALLAARATVASEPCPDADGDGVCNRDDNCPAVANPDQADSDRDADGEPDGFGDACDSCLGYGSIDTDGDGLCDEADTCPDLAAPDERDGDGDGIGDACDVCPAMPKDLRDTGSDRDGDGRPDVCDACPDDPADGCAPFLGCTASGALVRVAPGAEGASFVGWLGTTCGGLARDPGTETIYTLAFDATSRSLALFTVDATTAHATLVAPLAAPEGISIVPSGLGRAADGRLLTITRTGQQLLAIDPTTATATVVGATGLPDQAMRGLTDDGGSLVVADAAVLAGLDPLTGAATVRAALSFPVHCGGPQDRNVHALLSASNGELYALMRCYHQWFSYLAVIDRDTGEVAFAGNNLPRMTGLVARAGATVESCTNCIDDDGDGLVDLADPACCTNARPLVLPLRRARLYQRREGLAFDLRATLDTTALESTVPPVAAVALQVSDPTTGSHWCARVAEAAFATLHAGRTWRHRGAGRLRKLELVRTSSTSETMFRARGRRVPLAKAAGLEVHVGLQRGAATLPLCFAGSAVDR